MRTSSSARRRPSASRPGTAKTRTAKTRASKIRASEIKPARSRAAPPKTARKQIVQKRVAPPQPAHNRELTTKRRGELSELAFALKATTLGFGVCKPNGDSERYDTILDSRDLGQPRVGTPLWRVQVKCTTQMVEGMYRLNAARRLEGRTVPYKLGEIDFLAAYVIPEDTWYIVPLAAFLDRTSLLFRSRNDPAPGMYDAYFEAWHLLRPPMIFCAHCGAHTPVRNPIQP